MLVALSPCRTFVNIKYNLQINLSQKLATSAEHVVYQNCSECQNETKTTICVHNMFCRYSELTIFMNNLSSYCGLVDAKIRASDKDLTVCK